MMPDMNADADRLARLWDELVSGKHQQDDADADFLAAINQFEQLAIVPPVAPEIVARSWEKLIDGAGKLVPLDLDPAILKPTNGHAHAHPATKAIIENQRGRFETVSALYRIVAIAVMAGFLGGFITGGWSRIAMRIAGALTIDRNRGLLTDNDNVVGKITFDGTLFLAFTGAAFGVLAALLYIAVRRWIIVPRRWRPFTYSLLLLGVFGFVIMDPTNPDYVTFGPAWLNVMTFSFGYIVIGTVVGTLVEAFDRRIPALSALSGPQWLRWLKIAAMAPFAAIGFFATLAAVSTSSGVAPLLIALLLLVLAALWLMTKKSFQRVIHLRLSPAITYTMLAAPSLVGLILTLRAVATILGG